MLKCYFGGAIHPSEYTYVDACFATNQKEAKNIMWRRGSLDEECSGEWLEAKIDRKTEHDNLADPDRTEAYLVTDPQTLRLMGWRMEGESECDDCGLCAMDLPEFSVCSMCCKCAACGYEPDCEEHNQEGEQS